MSLHDLNKIVSRAAKALYDNEKFAVGVLAVRASNAAASCPTDPTLVAMSNFLNKRAESELFITRSELKSVYNKLYSQNNKFGSLFMEELGGSLESQVRYATRDPNEGKDFTKEAQAKFGDQNLASALAGVFEKKAHQPYSGQLAENAARTCLHELNRFAMPHKVEVVAGQADLLICQATYETPKGNTAVLVPVEVNEGRPLLPTVFLSQLGFVDLAKDALQDHILKSAGQKFSVDIQKLLEVVSSVKNGPRGMSEMDMIIAKAEAAKGVSTAQITNGVLSQAEAILNQTVDPKQPDLIQPRLAESDEYAKKLASTKGLAEFAFGPQYVDQSRKILARMFGSFGFPQAKIAVADADEHSIYFAVSVDGQLAVKVPMKISKADRTITAPKMIVANGTLVDFSKAGISQAMTSQLVEPRMMAVASPAYHLKPSELVEQVKVAMAEGNYVMAEDVLNVLAQAGHEPTYKEAVAIFMEGMNGKMTKSASAATCCSMQRSVTASKYMICGHTNLPVHKVYQDKHGDCHPLYRKNISEAEGGSFLHSKIYYG
jgi:hypothetical protein